MHVNWVCRRWNPPPCRYHNVPHVLAVRRLQLRIAISRAMAVSAFAAAAPRLSLSSSRALFLLYPFLLPPWADQRRSALLHLAGHATSAHLCLRQLMIQLGHSLRLPPHAMEVPTTGDGLSAASADDNPFRDTRPAFAAALPRDAPSPDTGSGASAIKSDGYTVDADAREAGAAAESSTARTGDGGADAGAATSARDDPDATDPQLPPPPPPLPPSHAAFASAIWAASQAVALAAGTDLGALSAAAAKARAQSSIKPAGPPVQCWRWHCDVADPCTGTWRCLLSDRDLYAAVRQLLRAMRCRRRLDAGLPARDAPAAADSALHPNFPRPRKGSLASSVVSAASYSSSSGGVGGSGAGGGAGGGSTSRSSPSVPSVVTARSRGEGGGNATARSEAAAGGVPSGSLSQRSSVSDADRQQRRSPSPAGSEEGGAGRVGLYASGALGSMSFRVRGTREADGSGNPLAGALSVSGASMQLESSTPLQRAGVASAGSASSHSMRRGMSVPRLNLSQGSLSGPLAQAAFKASGRPPGTQTSRAASVPPGGAVGSTATASPAAAAPRFVWPSDFPLDLRIRVVVGPCCCRPQPLSIEGLAAGLPLASQLSAVVAAASAPRHESASAGCVVAAAVPPGAEGASASAPAASGASLPAFLGAHVPTPEPPSGVLATSAARSQARACAELRRAPLEAVVLAAPGRRPSLASSDSAAEHEPAEARPGWGGEGIWAADTALSRPRPVASRVWLRVSRRNSGVSLCDTVGVHNPSPRPGSGEEGSRPRRASTGDLSPLQPTGPASETAGLQYTGIEEPVAGGPLSPGARLAGRRASDSLLLPSPKRQQASLREGAGPPAAGALTGASPPDTVSAVLLPALVLLELGAGVRTGGGSHFAEPLSAARRTRGREAGAPAAAEGRRLAKLSAAAATVARRAEVERAREVERLKAAAAARDRQRQADLERERDRVAQLSRQRSFRSVPSLGSVSASGVAATGRGQPGPPSPSAAVGLLRTGRPSAAASTGDALFTSAPSGLTSRSGTSLNLISARSLGSGQGTPAAVRGLLPDGGSPDAPPSGGGTGDATAGSGSGVAVPGASVIQLSLGGMPATARNPRNSVVRVYAASASGGSAGVLGGLGPLPETPMPEQGGVRPSFSRASERERRDGRAGLLAATPGQLQVTEAEDAALGAYAIGGRHGATGDRRRSDGSVNSSHVLSQGVQGHRPPGVPHRRLGQRRGSSASSCSSLASASSGESLRTEEDAPGSSMRPQGTPGHGLTQLPLHVSAATFHPSTHASQRPGSSAGAQRVGARRGSLGGGGNPSELQPRPPAVPPPPASLTSAPASRQGRRNSLGSSEGRTQATGLHSAAVNRFGGLLVTGAPPVGLGDADAAGSTISYAGSVSGWEGLVAPQAPAVPPHASQAQPSSALPAPLPVNASQSQPPGPQGELVGSATTQSPVDGAGGSFVAGGGAPAPQRLQPQPQTASFSPPSSVAEQLQAEQGQAERGRSRGASRNGPRLQPPQLQGGRHPAGPPGPAPAAPPWEAALGPHAACIAVPDTASLAAGIEPAALQLSPRPLSRGGPGPQAGSSLGGAGDRASGSRGHLAAEQGAPARLPPSARAMSSSARLRASALGLAVATRSLSGSPPTASRQRQQLADVSATGASPSESTASPQDVSPPLSVSPVPGKPSAAGVVAGLGIAHAQATTGRSAAFQAALLHQLASPHSRSAAALSGRQMAGTRTSSGTRDVNSDGSPEPLRSAKSASRPRREAGAAGAFAFAYGANANLSPSQPVPGLGVSLGAAFAGRALGMAEGHAAAPLPSPALVAEAANPGARRRGRSANPAARSPLGAEEQAGVHPLQMRPLVASNPGRAAGSPFAASAAPAATARGKGAAGMVVTSSTARTPAASEDAPVWKAEPQAHRASPVPPLFSPARPQAPHPAAGLQSVVPEDWGSGAARLNVSSAALSAAAGTARTGRPPVTARYGSSPTRAGVALEGFVGAGHATTSPGAAGGVSPQGGGVGSSPRNPAGTPSAEAPSGPLVPNTARAMTKRMQRKEQAAQALYEAYTADLQPSRAMPAAGSSGLHPGPGAAVLLPLPVESTGMQHSPRQRHPHAAGDAVVRTARGRGGGVTASPLAGQLSSLERAESHSHAQLPGAEGGTSGVVPASSYPSGGAPRGEWEREAGRGSHGSAGHGRVKLEAAAPAASAGEGAGDAASVASGDSFGAEHGSAAWLAAAAMGEGGEAAASEEAPPDPVDGATDYAASVLSALISTVKREHMPQALAFGNVAAVKPSGALMGARGGGGKRSPRDGRRDLRALGLPRRAEALLAAPAPGLKVGASEAARALQAVGVHALPSPAEGGADPLFHSPSSAALAAAIVAATRVAVGASSQAPPPAAAANRLVPAPRRTSAAAHASHPSAQHAAAGTGYAAGGDLWSTAGGAPHPAHLQGLRGVAAALAPSASAAVGDGAAGAAAPGGAGGLVTITHHGVQGKGRRSSLSGPSSGVPEPGAFAGLGVSSSGLLGPDGAAAGGAAVSPSKGSGHHRGSGSGMPPHPPASPQAGPWQLAGSASTSTLPLRSSFFHSSPAAAVASSGALTLGRSSIGPAQEAGAHWGATPGLPGTLSATSLSSVLPPRGRPGARSSAT